MKTQIKLFGTLQISNGKKIITFTRRKTKGLLVYLLLHSRPHRREKLAALFWSDASKSDGLRSLRVSLAELRANLGNGAVLVEQNSVRFNPDFYAAVDVRDFSNLVVWSAERGMSELSRLLSLYRGDLLEDIDDDWVLPLREQYQTQFIEGTLRGAEYCRSQADYLQAIEFAQKAIAFEPTNERAYQIIMSCYAAQNNMEFALRQYETLSRLLAEEFGAKPAPATEALRESILRQNTHSPSVHFSNLPQIPTSFIGRQTELERLSAILKKDAYSPLLITLTGTGGVGKSRTAIETAKRLLNDYPDGVLWVELSPVADSAGLEQAIAKIIGAKEGVGQSLRESILQTLKPKHALLIFDNCEHLLSVCASMTEQLWKTCSSLHILTTSREPLGAAHERVVIIHSLNTPSHKDKGTQSILSNESVKLFLERASNHQTPFHLGRETAPMIAEICGQLDGLPLAIELAAAQVHVVGLPKIQQQLQKVGKHNTRSFAYMRRHASLRDMVAWSYNLLNETEQILLRRLSVFTDHWTEDQAIVIAGGFTDSSIHLMPKLQTKYAIPVSAQTVVRSTLSSLTAKSLIQVQREGNDTRYSMLDTIRQFVKEALKKSGEKEFAQARHSEHFLQMTASLWKHAYTLEEKSALDTLETEYANLRSALLFAKQDKKTYWNSDLIDMLGRFWLIRSSAAEGRKWLARILHHPGMKHLTRERGVACLQAGLIALNQNDQKAAERFFTEARKIFEHIGDTLSLSNTLNNHGNVFFYQENYKKAREYYEQSLALARATGNLRAKGFALNNLALTMSTLNEKEQALRLLEEGLELRKKMGDKRGMGIVLNNLGDLAAETGKFGRARQYYIRSLRLRVEMGDERGMLIPLGNLLNLFVIQKKSWKRNAMLLGFTDEIVKRTGMKFSPEAKAVFESIRSKTKEMLNVGFEKEYQAGKFLKADEVAVLAAARL
jgi:predicted ATPase/DNA-binding SARP family transcriptional activator